MPDHIVVEQWIARCSVRIAALLPNLGSATAAERAEQMLPDAYHYEPEVAAEVYVQELGPHDVPWDRGIPGEWAISFDVENGMEEGVERAVAAAHVVLQAHGVSVYDGTLAKFKLESWDDSGFDDNYKLAAKLDADLRVWFEAEEAANTALNDGDPSGKRYGYLGASPPSKVRFDEAHKRWQARRSEGAMELTSQARAPERVNDFATPSVMNLLRRGVVFQLWLSPWLAG